jgi:hypothetical protein|uniref:Uncharacterized protein n=1 Tax=viral metagenome TaxID=1070528 RepID=A0A6C0BWC8_9ZZZZ
MAAINIESLDELGKLLDEPQKKMAWIKLDKNSKKLATTIFVDEILTSLYELSPENVNICKDLLIDLINKKKLSKAKDIIFNIEEHRIEKIPCLTFENNCFHIATEKRPATSKSLPNMKNFVRTNPNKTLGNKHKLSFDNEDT